jgi:hypothetical protein
MRISRLVTGAALVLVLGVTAGCGSRERQPVQTPDADQILDEIAIEKGRRGQSRQTIWDIFRPRADVGQVGAVNKYIWNAALETLDFLPVTSVDPFTGVITTGYGTPPGGGRAYRATIYVSDPALDARSLNIALMTNAGPAPAATVRAVEDAILTRARQLRAQDGRI